MTSSGMPQNSGRWSKYQWEAIVGALAFVPLVPVTFRLIRVSEFNPDVMFLLVRTADLVPLIIASTTMMLPLLVDYAIIVLAAKFVVGSPSARVRYWKFTEWVLLPFVVLVLCVQSPISLMFLATLYLMYVARLHFLRRKSHGFKQLRARQRSEVSNLIQLATSTCLLLIFASSTMWLPRQIITYEGGNDVVYILEEGERFTTVMTVKERWIKTLKTEDVSMRQPCGDGQSAWGRTLLDLFFAEDRITLEKCPKGR